MFIKLQRRTFTTLLYVCHIYVVKDANDENSLKWHLVLPIIIVTNGDNGGRVYYTLAIMVLSLY